MWACDARLAHQWTCSRHSVPWGGPEQTHRLRLEAWLNADLVVHGAPEVLLATEVFLSSLHGDVRQQELNLLQLAARNMA
jgi:hypothetical protein